MFPAQFTNSLLSFQGFPLRDVVARYVALRPRLPVFRVPPVAFLRADDVEKVSLLEGEVVVRTRVVIKFRDKSR